MVDLYFLQNGIGERESLRTIWIEIVLFRTFILCIGRAVNGHESAAMPSGKRLARL